MCQHHPHDTHQAIVRRSRHRYERLLFALAAMLTLLGLAVALALSVYKQETVAYLQNTAVESHRAEHPETAAMSAEDILAKLSADERETIDLVESLSPSLVLLAPLAFLLLIVYSVGKIYGEARASGVQVTPEQFGQVHAEWADMARKLGFEKIPELYIQNGNGALNAFATCLPGYREFGVIYSDILERTLAENDPDTLRFILGHELGHIRLRHVAWWYHLLSFAAKLPGLNYLIGLPLSRAREYGCDKIGLELSGDRDCKGLMMLAAGKHLYRQVDMAAYENNHIHNGGFWAGVHNFFIDHPVISWRIAALRQNRHGDLLWPSQHKPPQDQS